MRRKNITLLVTIILILPVGITQCIYKNNPNDLCAPIHEFLDYSLIGFQLLVTVVVYNAKAEKAKNMLTWTAAALTSIYFFCMIYNLTDCLP